MNSTYAKRDRGTYLAQFAPASSLDAVNCFDANGNPITEAEVIDFVTGPTESTKISATGTNEEYTMEPTINVALTLAQMEAIADALEFTGKVIQEELDGVEPGTEEHDGLSADLEDLTHSMGVIATAMDELVGKEE